MTRNSQGNRLTLWEVSHLRNAVWLKKTFTATLVRICAWSSLLHFLRVMNLGNEQKKEKMWRCCSFLFHQIIGDPLKVACEIWALIPLDLRSQTTSIIRVQTPFFHKKNTLSIVNVWVGCVRSANDYQTWSADEKRMEVFNLAMCVIAVFVC